MQLCPPDGICMYDDGAVFFVFKKKEESILQSINFGFMPRACLCMDPHPHSANLTEMMLYNIGLFAVSDF